MATRYRGAMPQIAPAAVYGVDDSPPDGLLYDAASGA
jgi:hypothetical protein